MSGVWVKVHPDDAGGGTPEGAAVISGSNGAVEDKGVLINGATYDIYTFTDDMAGDMSLTVDTPGLVDILMVGGGGGGGTYVSTASTGGGGGAGALRELFGVYIDENTDVFVGIGGNGSFASTNGYSGYNGHSSKVGPYFAVGGGGGGMGDLGYGSHYGKSGASGGGSGGATAESGSGGGEAMQDGFPGGSSNGVASGAGGGGATEAGRSAVGNTGGTGGAGKDCSSFIGASAGTLVLAAGGGGGGNGQGGSGIGGNGVDLGNTNGAVNTGSGGGGGFNNSAAGNGGSGIVIVRVKTSDDPTPVSYNSASGGTETIVDNYNGTNEQWKVHTFTFGGDTTLTVDSATNPFHVLVAGGGGNGGSTGSQGWQSGSGGGGAVYENESADLSGQATYNVTVGTNGNPGGASILETFPQQNGGVKGGNSTTTTAAGGASGNGNAGAPLGSSGTSGGTTGDYNVAPNGLFSTITGETVLYGAGRADGFTKEPNTGCGGNATGGGNQPGNPGEKGVVIVAYQIGVSA